MAKTRAQRKAERRAREAEAQKRTGSERRAESRAQHDTQVPVPGGAAGIRAVEAGTAGGGDEAALKPPAAPGAPRSTKHGPEAKPAKQLDRVKRDEQKRRE